MSLIKHFSKNLIGTDFVVGDIHGCFDDLQKLLSLAKFDEDCDRLFSVGDLVDRGPLSYESIGWIAKPWFHAVRGNHEQMAIGVASGRHSLDNYLRNGGAWFMDMTAERRELYAEAFNDLPLAMEIETPHGLVGIVHAEVYGNDWDMFRYAIEHAESNNKRHHIAEIALWSRKRIYAEYHSVITGIHKVYVGHTPVETPEQYGNVIYIDTGRVFGGRMTLANLHRDGEFISLDALE